MFEFLLRNSGGKTGCRRPFLLLLNLGTPATPPHFHPGCRGQRWTVQTCLTCQRSQRFLNDPDHLLWGDRPEAQLGSQAGERFVEKNWGCPRKIGVMGDIELKGHTGGFCCERCYNLKKFKFSSTQISNHHSPCQTQPTPFQPTSLRRKCSLRALVTSDGFTLSFK